MNLSILCVSQGRPYSQPFVAKMQRTADELEVPFILIRDGKDLHSAGYLESVLDQAVDQCPEGWVLRLDDDEALPDETVEWLASGAFEAADHWAFKRRNLWPDADHFIANPPLLSLIHI